MKTQNACQIVEMFPEKEKYIDIIHIFIYLYIYSVV